MPFKLVQLYLPDLVFFILGCLASTKGLAEKIRLWLYHIKNPAYYYIK